MLFFPLIERELGIRSRRAGNYWSRFAVGGFAVLICLPFLLSPDFSGTASTAGVRVFNTLIAIAFVLCCVACVLTADVIGAEQRDGTLGLLFLTKVKWFDVILGKLATNGVVGLAALLTLMPFLMIPVLAGGVTGGEALRKGLALLNALFLSLAVGIYSSSCVPEKFKASRRAAARLTGINLLPLLVLPVWFIKSFGPWLPGVFSPLRAVIVGGDYDYQLSPLPYWMSFIVIHAFGWAFLFRAGTKVRRLVRDEQRSVRIRRQSTDSALRSNSPDRSGWRFAVYPPVEWLVRRQRGLKAILWFGVLMGVIYYLVFRVFSPWRAFGTSSSFWLVAYWVPTVLVGGLSGVFFAWAASRFFIEIWRNGELELLLTTPSGAGSIAQDQWKVLQEALLLPLIVSVAALVVPFVFTILLTFSNSGGSAVIFPYFITILFNAINLVIGILALCRVGLWYGMKASGQAGAIVWTVGAVKGVPYLLNLAWSLFSALFGFPFRTTISTPYYFLSWLPSIATLIFYLWIIRAAKHGVLAELSGSESKPPKLARNLSQAIHELANFIGKFRNWNTT